MTSISSVRPQVYMLTVEPAYADQRLDNFLMRELKGVPKSKVYQMIRKGEVRVNKKRAKPDTRLQANDVIRIPPVRQAQAQAEVWVENAKTQQIESCILWEDAELIILNKPAGWAVHGGSGVSLGVIEALRVQRPQQNLELVHRLDRGTSGCLMIAKKRSALKRLHAALQAGEIRKNYLALVTGIWPKRLTRMTQPLLKRTLSTGGRMVKVDAQGKASETQFKCLITHPQASLIQAFPVTGRTHQIRVHCQFAEHPIVGDDTYGDKNQSKSFKSWGVQGLCLHAYELELPGSDGKQLRIKAPIPEGLQNAINYLRKNGGVTVEKLKGDL